ncbi:MAG: FHA domain-containing protein [Acidobacteriota bacterium]
MVDLNDKHLVEIERYLIRSVAQSETITENDLDAREIIYQIIEQVKQNAYSFSEGVYCVPNIVTIAIPETKVEEVEDIETIFSTQQFLAMFEGFLAGQNMRLFNPLRVEVQTVSKGNSRVMYGRAALFLDWPGPEMEAEDVRVSIDIRKRKILAVQPPRPQIPQLARLTALNADVYQNRYLITKPSIHIGRLRTVINEESGQLLRRNDFVFAHQELVDAAANSVSRQHATIYYQSGGFFIVDHNSANGTSIQRGQAAHQIAVLPQANYGTPLEHGDILRFGSAWVSFEFVRTEEVDFQLHYQYPSQTDPYSGVPKTTNQVNKQNLSNEDREKLEAALRRTRERY